METPCFPLLRPSQNGLKGGSGSGIGSGSGNGRVGGGGGGCGGFGSGDMVVAVHGFVFVMDLT